MADISDITAYLETAAAAAVYPNGTGQPSVAAMDVRIFEGWPLPDQLDLDVAGMVAGNPPTPRASGPVANVSIFTMLGMNAQVYQIQDHVLIIAQPVYGIALTVANGVTTFAGAPNTGEYVTIIINRSDVYSATGATAAEIIATLIASINIKYPLASSTSSTITIPNTYALVVRQGGVGTLGKVTHRQKQSIMISVWAPNHASRSLLAKAIDVAIKNQNIVTMPDTSQVLICYNRTNLSDEKQMATIYRRDLIYDVEYATVFQFPGYVITSVNTSIANPSNTAIANAVT